MSFLKELAFDIIIVRKIDENLKDLLLLIF